MDRSRSRSRARGEGLVSTGRGGAGNLVRKEEQFVEHADEPRGRQAGAIGDRVTHTGRGGAGNVRSPSRDPETRKAEEAEAAREAKIIREHQEGPHSTGRGGLGNITRSRSPSANPPHVHSTGRGGAGNIHSDMPLTDADKKIMEEDAQVLQHHHHETASAVHSTGRGGEGNMTTAAPHPLDASDNALIAAAHERDETEPHSSGRGGAGNILHSTTHDEEDGRGRQHHKGVVGKIISTFSSKSRERPAGNGHAA